MSQQTPKPLVGKKGTIPVDCLAAPPRKSGQYVAHIAPRGGVSDPTDPLGGRKIPDPFGVDVDVPGLHVAQQSLVSAAQAVLGKMSDGRPAYAFGGEGAQHGGRPLPQLLIDAGDAGFEVFQPSGNHIDLERCFDDADYRDWVLAVHKAAGIPLLSVSVHMDAYFLLSAVGNQRARAILSPDTQLNDAQLQQLLKQRMARIILGAAALGVQVLHLFWGEPHGVPPYGWPFHEAGGQNVVRMREHFVEIVRPLVELAARCGVYLCHEIHFGTFALNADDFITVWDALGKPLNFAIGFDPSHFWHGELWHVALDKLRKAGVQVVVPHFKQTVLLPGRPMLGYEADDRNRGMMFSSLDATSGIVDMNLYAGQLTLPGTGLVEFWHAKCNLPIPGYAEAEDPHWLTWDVLTRGVAYLQATVGKMRLPKAHFTAEMKQPA